MGSVSSFSSRCDERALRWVCYKRVWIIPPSPFFLFAHERARRLPFFAAPQLSLPSISFAQGGVGGASPAASPSTTTTAAAGGAAPPTAATAPTAFPSVPLPAAAPPPSPYNWTLELDTLIGPSIDGGTCAFPTLADDPFLDSPLSLDQNTNKTTLNVTNGRCRYTDEGIARVRSGGSPPRRLQMKTTCLLPHVSPRSPLPSASSSRAAAGGVRADPHVLRGHLAPR